MSKRCRKAGFLAGIVAMTVMAAGISYSTPASGAQADAAKVRLRSYPQKPAAISQDDLPKEGIQLQASQSLSSPLPAGSSLIVTGQVDAQYSIPGATVTVSLVPQGPGGFFDQFFNEESNRSVQVTNNGTFSLSVPLGDISGPWQISAWGSFREESLYSNVLKFLVKPVFVNVSGIYFEDNYANATQGYKEDFPALVAITATGKYDISYPFVGTTFWVENSSIARVVDDQIEGVAPGQTTLHATFMGFEASIPFKVLAASTVDQIVEPQPQNPALLEPNNQAVVSVGETVTLRATPFDSSQGHDTERSVWEVLDVTNNKIVAGLRDGTESYAEWVPEWSGHFIWRMKYTYYGGETEFTAPRNIVVQ